MYIKILQHFRKWGKFVALKAVLDGVLNGMQ